MGQCPDREFPQFSLSSRPCCDKIPSVNGEEARSDGEGEEAEAGLVQAGQCGHDVLRHSKGELLGDLPFFRRDDRAGGPRGAAKGHRQDPAPVPGIPGPH